MIVFDTNPEVVRPETLVTSYSFWMQLTVQAEKEIETYQQRYPLRMGIPREELKSRLKMSSRNIQYSSRTLVG